MKTDWSDDRANAGIGAFILRITLGALFVAHLYWKIDLLPGGIQHWWANFAANGYPWFVPYYVFSVEVIGALLLIPGIYTRYVALYAIPMMLGAAEYWIVRKGFYFTAAGGELPIVWSVMLLVQAFLGSGAYACPVPVLNARFLKA